MGRIGVILSKELVDNLRDGRSLAAALVYPLIGPLLVGVLIALLSSLLVLDRQSTISIAVRGAGHAPALTAYLEVQGVAMREAADDPRLAVRRGRHATALIIPEAYSGSFARGEPATVEVILDSSRLALAAEQRPRQHCPGRAKPRKLHFQRLDPVPGCLRTLAQPGVLPGQRSDRGLLAPRSPQRPAQLGVGAA